MPKPICTYCNKKELNERRNAVSCGSNKCQREAERYKTKLRNYSKMDWEQFKYHSYYKYRKRCPQCKVGFIWSPKKETCDDIECRKQRWRDKERVWKKEYRKNNQWYTDKAKEYAQKKKEERNVNRVPLIKRDSRIREKVYGSLLKLTL